MTGGNRQQKYKMFDKIINPKKSIAQHNKSPSNIIICSFSKCKKDFRLISFMCFLEGNHINSTLATYSKTFLSIHQDIFWCNQKYFVLRKIKATLIECQYFLINAVKVMTR